MQSNADSPPREKTFRTPYHDNIERCKAVLTIRALPIFVVISCGAVALAAPATIDSGLVRAGVKACDGLEYQRAIDLLHRALRESLTIEEKQVTYRTLAFAEVALEQREQAIADFKALLEIDPDFVLDRTISPRVRDVFDAAKEAVARKAKSGTPPPIQALPELRPIVSPARIKDGQPVEIRVDYSGGVAQHLDLFHRQRGQTAYARLSVPAIADGHFVLLLPGLAVHAPGVEYFLSARDGADVVIAHAGSAAQPLGADVEPPLRHVAVRPWIWGIVAGVAAAGVIGLAVGLTQHPSIAASTPASVTIHAH
jgi:hypothetical protein